MIANEHTVKEWHITCDTLPNQIFKVQAESFGEGDEATYRQTESRDSGTELVKGFETSSGIIY
jgi:hypothetical protein